MISVYGTKLEAELKASLNGIQKMSVEYAGPGLCPLVQHREPGDPLRHPVVNALVVAEEGQLKKWWSENDWKGGTLMYYRRW